MLQVQEYLFQLLVVAEAPSVLLEGSKVHFPDESKLRLGQDKLVGFHWIVVHYEQLGQLLIAVLR